jgi:hypothetical protein
LSTELRPSGIATVKRYAVLGYGAFGTMLDVGLLALGSLLVGIAISVFLAGLGLSGSIPDEMSTGSVLVSGLVLAVAGLFCLGLASEGPLGRGRRLEGFKLWELGIGRTLAVFAIGLGTVLAHGLLIGLMSDLPVPLLAGLDLVRAVGVTGMVAMPLIGVPASLVILGAPVEREWIHLADLPVMFVVWVAAALIVVS